MNKENCALKLVNEIILYYDARSKKHQNNKFCIRFPLFFVCVESVPSWLPKCVQNTVTSVVKVCN